MIFSNLTKGTSAGTVIGEAFAALTGKAADKCHAMGTLAGVVLGVIVSVVEMVKESECA